MVDQTVLLISTTTLVVELFVLSLLFFSYYLKRRKMYRQHGITNTTAVALHLVTILSWMIWSFMAFFGTTSVDFGNLLHVTALAHAALGIIAAALGVWLVGSWHLQTDVQKCFSRKRLMLTAISVWTVNVAIGVVLYVAVILS
jgi:hypothetical protein